MTTRELAEAYLATFSPADQEAIRAGFGGRDLIVEWYNNAVAAGAVPAQYAPGGTGSSGAGFTGPGGKPTPSELRAWARSQGWSEDFERFSDATLQNWITNYWDSANNKFRSARGAEGSFEKPTECPPGTGPSGPDESDPCTSEGYGGGAGTGGGEGGEGGGGEGGGGEPTESTRVGGSAGASTLQQYLEALYGRQGGIFSPTSGAEGVSSGFAATPLEHGGVMWSPLHQLYGGFNPGPTPPVVGQQGGCPEGQVVIRTEPDGTYRCGSATPTPTPTGPSQTTVPPGGPLNAGTPSQTPTPTTCPAGQILRNGVCVPLWGSTPSGGGRGTGTTSGDAASGAAALTAATLNAFGPSAPSAMAAPASTPVTAAPPTVPATPFPTPTAAPAAPKLNPQLTAQIGRKYNPYQGQWWRQA